VKDQNEPVSPDEFVLRAIPNVYYQPDLEPSVARDAFQANRTRDAVGLSVFRESCFPDPTQAPSIIANALRQNGNYYVARLAVAHLSLLGLAVTPDPQQDSPPGHALIPQLGYMEYAKNKHKAKEIQLELAKLASDPRAIVFAPATPKQQA